MAKPISCGPAAWPCAVVVEKPKPRSRLTRESQQQRNSPTRRLDKRHWRSWRGRNAELQSLNARSASNKSSSIFFSKPCGKSGDSACGAACLAGRHLRSHPNDDSVSVARRDRNRAQLPARRHQPIRLLSALAAIGAAPGRDRTARRHSTPGSQAPPWLHNGAFCGERKMPWKACRPMSPE